MKSFNIQCSFKTYLTEFSVMSIFVVVDIFIYIYTKTSIKHKFHDPRVLGVHTCIHVSTMTFHFTANPFFASNNYRYMQVLLFHMLHVWQENFVKEKSRQTGRVFMWNRIKRTLTIDEWVDLEVSIETDNVGGLSFISILSIINKL